MKCDPIDQIHQANRSQPINCTDPESLQGNSSGSNVPDFYLVGAPRCGTTAFASYLADHPGICFSKPKEPHYFAYDMPGFREHTDLNSFMSECFSHRTGEQMLGEGSVWYLYSESAIPAILDAHPGAKFILMLRNPMEMVPSFHQKAFESLDEDIESFTAAWHQQKIRQTSNQYPTLCRDPKVLHYAEVGKLGKYTSRFIELVPANQRHIILYDDFSLNPTKAYTDTLELLGLPYDQRGSFERVNAHQKVVSQRLLKLALRPPKSLLVLSNIVRKMLGLRQLNLLPRLRRKLVVPEQRVRLSPAMEAELWSSFTEDINLLSRTLERDLSHWQPSKR